MVDFSVEGMTSLKSEEANRAEQEKDRELRNRQMTKQTDVYIKRMEKEKEKASKVAEQRATRILNMKVQRRFQVFPWLAEKVPPVSAKASLAELEETDEMQKLELDLQGAEDRLLQLIKQGAFLIEGIWGDGSKMTFLPDKARLDLRNFGKVVNSDTFMREAEPLILETTIEYPTIGQMNLPMRWVTCVLNAMVMVHHMNTNPVFKKLMEQDALAEQQQEEFLSEEGESTQETTTTGEQEKPKRGRKPKRT
jgi:hypothetical protein